MSTKKKRKPLKRRKPSTPPRFAVGDQVRVKYGTADFDFPDIPLGGWAETITEVSHDAKSHLYLIEWNQFTLDHMPPIFRKRCERDGLDEESSRLGEEDLEPDVGDRVPLEQPVEIVTRPLRPTDQDDRIRAIFGLTSDDPLGCIRDIMARFTPVEVEGLPRFFGGAVGYLGYRGYKGTLTAADVKASFERFLSPAVAAPLASLFDAVEGFDDFRAGRTPGVAGLETSGNGVLRVRLARAVPFFLQLLTLPDITVLPPALLTDPGRARRLPSGTGAFVPREITFGRTARFDRYDAYWDRGRIALDGIDLDLAEDSEGGVFQRFLDGQLDVIWDIPFPEAARLMADPEWRPYIDSSTQLHTSFLVLRCDRAPLDDVRVRRALNHAVDRVALNERTFAGLTMPASSILPPHLVGHDPALRPYRHDQERARALLREAGRGEGLTLSAWLSPKDARDPLNPLPAVAAQLEAVGVKLVLEVLPGEEMSARTRSGVFPDVKLSRWFADFPDPDTFFSSLFYSKTEDVLDGGYRNVEVDRLVEKGARLLDAAERESVYRELNRLVQSEAPVVFLFHNRGFVVQAPRLRGAQAHLLPPPVRWNDLWLEP